MQQNIRRIALASILLACLFYTVEASAQEHDLFDLTQLALAANNADAGAEAEAVFNVEQPESDRKPRREAFTKGSWSLQAYGAAAFTSSDGEQYDGHAGGGYYFHDGVSFNIEALGGWVNSRYDTDGDVSGADLLLRWHFLRRASWSLYIDGGIGFQVADTDFPSDSRHAFRPQAGIGATIRLGDHLHIMTGGRYLHLSNAGTSDINEDFDGPQAYLGLMWSW